MKKFFQSMKFVPLLFVALIIAGSFVATSEKVGAFAGGYNGVNGYFTNGGYSGGCGYSNGCAVLPNQGYAFDAFDRNFYRGGASSVDKAGELVAQLKGYYGQGDWGQTGAAFVVKTMLGIRDFDKTVTAAQWNDVSQRLLERANSGRIDWFSYQSTDGVDTYSGRSGGQFDIFYDNEVATKPGFAIYNDSGQIVYKAFYSCGNPVGAVAGLPPAFNFDLVPTIGVTPTSSEGGAQVSLTPAVTNSGATVSKAVQWQVTNFKVDPNQPVPAAGSSAQTPVQYYGHNATVVQSGNQAFNRNVTNLSVGPQTLSDYPVGTKICYALSVQPRRHDDARWQHSTPACVVISKKPKIQVQGNDLIVGKGVVSNIVTSTTTKNVGGTNRTFGSWGEYGVIASGSILGLASGAGYSGGATSAAVCDVSLLTFTNAGTTTCSPSTAKGGYVMSKLLPDIGARLIAGSSLGPNPTVNVAVAGKGSYAATGNVSVTSSGDIAKGKWVVINAPTATVTIKNNIVYTNSALQTIADIPQVVIIANQINIDSGVTHVDAWLIATGVTGSINTCTEVTNPATAGQLNAGKCNQKLTVNGPVVARHLYLYRTAGSGTGLQTGDPAEVFNLRPDAYLWATSYSSTAGRLQTVSSKELPPRF